MDEVYEELVEEIQRKLTEQEYTRIHNDLERAYLVVTTDSNWKKIKHNYMLTNGEVEVAQRLFHIVAAEIRQAHEKVFMKYIDNVQDLNAKIDSENRKKKYAGRGRKSQENLAPTKAKAVSSKKAGGLTIEKVEYEI
jgi:hypothetical protein